MPKEMICCSSTHGFPSTSNNLHGLNHSIWEEGESILGGFRDLPASTWVNTKAVKTCDERKGNWKGKSVTSENRPPSYQSSDIPGELPSAG